MQIEFVMLSFKELEQLKLSSSSKSATVDKFITKNLRKQYLMLRPL